MNKYWKLLDWIIGGIVTIFFLYSPMLSGRYGNIYIFYTSLTILGVFLIYCFSSGIYWMVKKNFKITLHYILIVTIYICFSISLFFYAAYHG
ncbi:MAG: hypothetical protein KIB00_01295 [Paeniclostridium sordellii]|nr:hypothetical protein [Paeniclostridium sordellii]